MVFSWRKIYVPIFHEMREINLEEKKKNMNLSIITRPSIWANAWVIWKVIFDGNR